MGTVNITLNKEEEAWLKGQDKNFIRDMVKAHMSPIPIHRKQATDDRGVGLICTPTHREKMSHFYATFLADKWMSRKGWSG